jgi:hypothetical protein
LKMRIDKNTTGMQNVLLRCLCGEIGIVHYGYNGNHLCVKARMICRDCNKTMKIVKVD